MNFRTLKPILFVAAIAVFSLACKEATPTKEKAPVEQKSDAHEHPHTDAATTPEKKPTNDVALNPPHGQPGHRCDIAVGQPLNSQPKPKNNTNVNPPHGQPGHRCDIAVGQPLNSQPKQKSNTNINPPHGQPGHRCDIAVGAPLSK